MGVNKKGKLFVVSAPSGAGKTSLVHKVLPRLQRICSIGRVVTYTTRPRRHGEKPNGVDYHFISQRAFEQKIAEGFFMEWSCAYGHYYGSPISTLQELEQGNSRIAILDIEGACSIVRCYPQAILIWLYTQNLDVLRERLAQRGADTLGQIEQRLQLAARELAKERAKKVFQYKILNNSFERAVEELFVCMRSAILL